MKGRLLMTHVEPHTIPGPHPLMIGFHTYEEMGTVLGSTLNHGGHGQSWTSEKVLVPWKFVPELALRLAPKGADWTTECIEFKCFRFWFNSSYYEARLPDDRRIALYPYHFHVNQSDPWYYNHLKFYEDNPHPHWHPDSWMNRNKKEQPAKVA